MIGDGYIDRVLGRVVKDNTDHRLIIELRCKLEMRTLFLRASLAVNTGLFAGLIVQIMRHFQII